MGGVFTIKRFFKDPGRILIERIKFLIPITLNGIILKSSLKLAKQAQTRLF